MGVDRLAVKYPHSSPYVFSGNNPLTYVDPNGDSLKVVNNAGEYLFMLDDGCDEMTEILAKDLYDQGTQWFEPDADNYMPLIGVADDISSNSSLKHFSWTDIGNFAMKSRMMISYRTGGSGDWKERSSGGDGYFLVTVGGQPYWGDAIGQIPFAADYVTDLLDDGLSMDDAILKTIDVGRNHGGGQISGRKRDNSNGYDHYFVLRAAYWAAWNQTMKEGGSSMQMPTSYMRRPASGTLAKRYGLR